MKCPACSNDDTKVIDSRPLVDGFGVRRRRECTKCDFRFSTVEVSEILELTVVKSDGKREPYIRDKIESGLRRALEKRPCNSDQFRQIVSAIERAIQKTRKNEITSSEIGEYVMEHLRNFDSVAYIRFASVYRSFEDVQTFQAELNKLVSKSRLKTTKKIKR